MKEQALYQVPVPRKTSSYSPVPHKEIIEHTKEHLDKCNMIATNTEYHTARDGQQLIGYMDISPDADSSLGMRLAFRNSYDKSMSVAFVAGAVVWICGNGMISGNIQFMRKHTGSVVLELKESITNAVAELNSVFDRSLKHSDALKRIYIDKVASAELCGRLFIEQDIITSTQLSIIKKEINDPTHIDFVAETAWSLYNHITFSLKEAHPSKYLKQHINIHDFFEQKYSLI